MPNHAMMCFLRRMTGHEVPFLCARHVYIERASLPSHHTDLIPVVQSYSSRPCSTVYLASKILSVKTAALID